MHNDVTWRPTVASQARSGAWGLSCGPTKPDNFDLQCTGRVLHQLKKNNGTEQRASLPNSGVRDSNAVPQYFNLNDFLAQWMD